MIYAIDDGIGRSVPCLEDPPLLTDRGCFVADIALLHQLHLVTHIATAALRVKVLEAAAQLMQRPAAALDFSDGLVTCNALPGGASVTLGEIARAAPAELNAEGWYRTEHMNYLYGVHIAVVRVDRETGGVEIERYLAAYDIGRAVNLMPVEDQMAGGFAQGPDGALLEEFVYDERGSRSALPLPIIYRPPARFRRSKRC